MLKEFQLSGKVDAVTHSKVLEYARRYDLTVAQVLRRALKLFFASLEKTGSEE